MELLYPTNQEHCEGGKGAEDRGTKIFSGSKGKKSYELHILPTDVQNTKQRPKNSDRVQKFFKRIKKKQKKSPVFLLSDGCPKRRPNG